MTFDQTLAYLYSRLPVFHRQGPKALHRDLRRTHALLEALGQPHLGIQTIHVGGTNGKGSVSTMLAALLHAAGVGPVGLYTSPHIVDFTERLQVNGRAVEKDWVVQFVAQHRALIETVEPSFFELTVAMAFAYFRAQGCRWQVIEVGLGGRLDSTNVVQPALCVLTHVDFDHMDVLGPTLPLIAAEKAGIIKPGVPVVVGRHHPETDPVFLAAAATAGAPIHWAPDAVRATPAQQVGAWHVTETTTGASHRYTLPLVGDWQGENLCTVLAALPLLQPAGVHLAMEDVQAVLATVTERLTLRARLEQSTTDPRVWVDMAHNAPAVSALFKYLAGQRKPTEPWYVVYGTAADKDLPAILAALPKDATYCWVASDTPRALPAPLLQTAAAELGLVGEAYTGVAQGLAAAQAACPPFGRIVVCGSAVVAGEALTLL